MAGGTRRSNGPDAELHELGLVDGGAPRVRLERMIHNANNPVTARIHRVWWPEGRAVRKELVGDGPHGESNWTTSDDPGHWNHWRREAEAYRRGIDGHFRPAGIRAPRLLGSLRPRPSTEVLWMEDVDGIPGAGWSVARHAEFARALGRAQGAIATEGNVSDAPWLSRRWTRQYATSRPPGPAILEDDRRWEHPTVRRCLHPGIRAGWRRMWAELDWWFEILESLPRTLCHFDVWPQNLIATADGFVLLDWSFVGWGALGEDIGNLVPHTMLEPYLPADHYDTLDAASWHAYVDGVLASGWRGDVRLIRLAMCASVVKYCWLPLLMVDRVGHGGPTGYGGETGAPEAEILERRSVVFLAMLDRLEEARKIAADVGL